MTFAVTFGLWPTGPSLEMIWVDMLQTQTADLWVSGAQVTSVSQFWSSLQGPGRPKDPATTHGILSPLPAVAMPKVSNEKIVNKLEDAFICIYGNDDSSWMFMVVLIVIHWNHLESRGIPSKSSAELQGFHPFCFPHCGLAARCEGQAEERCSKCAEICKRPEAEPWKSSNASWIYHFT